MKNKNLILVGLAFYLGLLTPALFGADWYVDSAAGGVNNGTSWANAWTNLDRVAGVSGGDTVWISGGSDSKIYFLNNWRPLGGSDLAHCVNYRVSQESGRNGKVLIDGSNAPVSGDGLILFNAPGQDYVVISGNVNGAQHLALQNFTGFGNGVYITNRLNGALLQRKGITLEYIDFGDRRINIADSATQIEIGHCKIKPKPSSDGALYIGGLTGGWHANSIHDNDIQVGSTQDGQGNGDDAIQWAASVDIYNNSIRSYSVSKSVEGGQHQDGVQFSGQYVQIYGNYFENLGNCGIFFSNTVVPGQPLVPLQDIYVYNNVITLTTPALVNSLARAVESNAMGWSLVNNIRIDNNTIVDMPSLKGINMIVGRPGDPLPTVSNVEIKNNLLYNTGGIIAGDLTPSNPLALYFAVDNNLVDAGSQGQAAVYPPQTTSLTWSGHPMFVWYAPDSPGNDFHLRATDPVARNGGATLATFNTDKDGVTRPQGSAWDVGAYEYKSSTACSGPTAYFTASASKGYEPLTVNFNAGESEACTGTLSYGWVYGDGSPAETGVISTHTFTSGIYSVTLTVSNGAGRSSVSRTITVLPALVPYLLLGINFDGNVQDWSGKENVSEWSPNTPCYTSGVLGRGGCFSGGNAGLVVQVHPSAVLDPTEGLSQLTIAGWARKTSATVGGGLGGQLPIYGLTVLDQGLQATLSTAPTSNMQIRFTTTANTDTKWHHYAMTYDGSMMTLYLDGASVAQKPLTGNAYTGYNSNQDLTVGAVSAFDAKFNGTLDDFRLYDQALSSADIVALYSSTTDTKPPLRMNGKPSGFLLVGSSATQVSLETGEEAVCRYAITPLIPFASMTNSFASVDGILQTLEVTNLSSNTYTYYVRCQDTAGNTNTDDYLITFAVAQVPSNAGLVLKYDFENDFTTGDLPDKSSSGNNANCQKSFTVTGTLVQADQCPALAKGPDGSQAASFSGSSCRLDSDYFGVNQSPSLDNWSSGTISVWVYFNPPTDPNFQIPDTGFTSQKILDTYGPAHTWMLSKDFVSYTSFNAKNNNGDPMVLLRYPDENVNSSWNLYSLTWDGSTVKGFYNGVLFNEVPQQGIDYFAVKDYLAIGALQHAAARNEFTNNCVTYYSDALAHYNYPPDQKYVMPNAGFFVGRLDDIRIYNRALSDQEVAGLYTPPVGSSTTTTPTPPGSTATNQTQFQPFKNIFNPAKGEILTIRYQVANAAPVQLTLYNRRGEQVKAIPNPGPFQATWDGRNESGSLVASGVYLLVMRVGETKQMKKIVVVK